MATASRTCKILYFAWVREKMGRGGEEMEIPSSVSTVGEFIAFLKNKGGAYAFALENESAIQVAVDRTHASRETKLELAKEIALFPPVTGG